MKFTKSMHSRLQRSSCFIDYAEHLISDTLLTWKQLVKNPDCIFLINKASIYMKEVNSLCFHKLSPSYIL